MFEVRNRVWLQHLSNRRPSAATASLKNTNVMVDDPILALTIPLNTGLVPFGGLDVSCGVCASVRSR